MTGRHSSQPLPLTLEQRQALKLGAWLHRVNITRAHLAAKPIDPRTARGVRNLHNLAVMDMQRRKLREMLADQLEQAAQWPAVSGS